MNFAASRPAARRHRALTTIALAAAVSTSAVGVATARGAAEPANRAVTAGLACPGLPPGLALTGNGPNRVWRVTRSASKPVASVARGVITKAVRGRDGTIWVEARRVGRPNDEWRRIVRILPSGRRRVSETGEVELSHVGTFPGQTTVATYIDRDGRDPMRDTHGHVFVEHPTGARRSVSHSGGIEQHVSSAAPAVHRAGAGTRQGVVVLGWSVDLAELFTFHRLNGSRVLGLFDPNRDAPYGLPPYHRAPVLSPDGAKLSWTEGPDWSQELNRLVGNWKLVVADSRTGAESVRVRVGGLREELQHADYDGRYWVGTFSKRTRVPRTPQPNELRVRVVDTWAANPVPVDPGCNLGFIASIDWFVKG